VFFGSSDHRFYAVDVKSEAALWSFEADDEIVSDPAIAEGRVLFGTLRGTLYALR
jgi:outer membrane protein assembly factor BamB